MVTKEGEIDLSRKILNGQGAVLFACPRDLVLRTGDQPRQFKSLRGMGMKLNGFPELIVIAQRNDIVVLEFEPVMVQWMSAEEHARNVLLFFQQFRQ